GASAKFTKARRSVDDELFILRAAENIETIKAAAVNSCHGYDDKNGSPCGYTLQWTCAIARRDSAGDGASFIAERVNDLTTNAPSEPSAGIQVAIDGALGTCDKAVAEKGLPLVKHDYAKRKYTISLAM